MALWRYRFMSKLCLKGIAGHTLFFLTISAVFWFGWQPLRFSTGGNIMNIRSSAFHHKENIPQKYSCDGVDISPPLSWSGVPSETKSLALICDDPDAPAGTWVHWVVYNIPSEISQLEESIQAKEMLENGVCQGKNSFGRIGYGGPCPPAGYGPHRYFFKLYALDSNMDLKERGISKSKLLDAINGHILAEAQLIGTYERK
jgi:Raf kinase inhibitor-like YbhB/YbcL family protein